MSTENERTIAAMVASYRGWLRMNEDAVHAGTHGVAMNAASASGLALVAADLDVVRALEIAGRMPTASTVWRDAVRYLTALVADSLADTQPPARGAGSEVRHGA